MKFLVGVDAEDASLNFMEIKYEKISIKQVSSERIYIRTEQKAIC